MQEDFKNKISEKIWQIIGALVVIYVVLTCFAAVFVAWHTNSVTGVDTHSGGINGKAYSYGYDKDVKELAKMKRVASFLYRDKSSINSKAKDNIWSSIKDNATAFDLDYCEGNYCYRGDYTLSKDELWVKEFDLDDDGEKELLVSYYDSFYKLRAPIFIFKKVEDKYVNILRGGVGINLYEIRILESKTNGYHDIEVVTDDWHIKGKRNYEIMKFKKSWTAQEDGTKPEEGRDSYPGYKYNFSLNDIALNKENIIDSFDIEIGNTYNEKLNDAENVLWNYICKEESLEHNVKVDAAYLEEMSMHKEFTCAAFVDLNDDGKADVVGYNSGMGYMGSVAGTFFILLNKDGEYKNLNFDLINTDCNRIMILRNKTNDMHDIALNCGYESENKTRIMQFR